MKLFKGFSKGANIETITIVSNRGFNLLSILSAFKFYYL